MDAGENANDGMEQVALDFSLWFLKGVLNCHCYYYFFAKRLMLSIRSLGHINMFLIMLESKARCSDECANQAVMQYAAQDK